MNNRDLFLDEVDVVLAELVSYRARGPHLRIRHRFQRSGMEYCSPGEEVLSCSVIVRAGEFPVRLPVALRLVTDYLARHQHQPQSASQIYLGLRADNFYLRHGDNTGDRSRRLKRKFSASGLKEYVKRIRKALTLALQEAGLGIQGSEVLVSEGTVGNEVLYSLKATVEWQHVK